MYLIYIMCVSEQLSMCKHDHRVHTKVGMKKKSYRKKVNIERQKIFFFPYCSFSSCNFRSSYCFFVIFVFAFYSGFVNWMYRTHSMRAISIERTTIMSGRNIETIYDFFFYLRFFIRCVEQLLVAPKHRRNIQFSGIFL